MFEYLSYGSHGVCVCVCACACAFACLRVHVFVLVCISSVLVVCICVSLCVCMSFCARVRVWQMMLVLQGLRMYMRAFVSKSMQTCACLYFCVWRVRICVGICVFISVYFSVNKSYQVFVVFRYTVFDRKHIHVEWYSQQGSHFKWKKDERIVISSTHRSLH